jgi:hypothetical protein
MVYTAKKLPAVVVVIPTPRMRSSHATPVVVQAVDGVMVATAVGAVPVKPTTPLTGVMVVVPAVTARVAAVTARTPFESTVQLLTPDPFWMVGEPLTTCIVVLMPLKPYTAEEIPLPPE